MNTFILKWNPAISAYSAEQFINDLQELAEGSSLDIVWPLGKDCQIHHGDRIFVLREGNHNNGIVMAGYFCSDSYIDDNADSADECFAADIDPLVMINTDEVPYISMEDLKNGIKDVDWDACTSIIAITDTQAALLEHICLQYLYDHQEIFEGMNAAKSWDFDLENFESIPPTLQEYYKKRYGSNCERCHRKESEVTEMAYHLVLDDYDPEHPAPMNHHLHCLCSECWFGVSDE